MIDKILEKLIKILVSWYYKRTHFMAYIWGIDERNDIHILSEEVFEDYTRFGTREDKHIVEAIRGKSIEKENKDMENNKAGWNEYKDIKDTLVALLDKGYNKGMIQTVLEQIEEEKEQ